MKGLGTDEDKLIEILAGRTPDQIRQIRVEFDKQFGKPGNDLIHWIEKDTSGNFKKALICLAKGPAEVKADYLYAAMEGVGTNDKVLIDVMTQTSSVELDQVKQIYSKKYGMIGKQSKRLPGQTLTQNVKTSPNKLEYDIKDDTSGDFENILISLIRGSGKVDNLAVDESLAEKDADDLYAKGEGRVGTDDAFFIQVLTLRSNAHIQSIDKFYKAKHGKPLADAIKAETSFNFKKALTALTKPKDVYFAERIHEAVQGLGTNDGLLVYALTVHDKPTLQKIANTYQTLYKKNMADDVKGDTSGDYRKLLLARLA